MQDRVSVRSLFFTHAKTMHITQIAATRTPFVYTCRLSGHLQTVCILVNSRDYWMKRMHLKKHPITMFVVWKHASCLPHRVLCLEDGKEYKAYTCAVDPTKRTKATSSAFLGQLLCGVQSAYDTLKAMPYQSRRRYERQLEALSRRVKGRPLTVK